MKKFMFAAVLMLTGCVGPRIRYLEQEVAALKTSQRNTTYKIGDLESFFVDRYDRLVKRMDIIDVWDFRGRLRVLDNFREDMLKFKAAHDKRWPNLIEVKK